MRYFLLPGFGEGKFCYRHLRKYFEQQSLVDVDYVQILENIPPSQVNIDRLAHSLIDFYGIKQGDIIIGHSMGGYVGAKIHQLIGCKLVMIASFSDPDKIYRISNSRLLNYNFARMGGLKTNRFQKFLWDKSKNTAHADDMKHVLANFKQFSNSSLAKSTIISFGPKIDLKNSENVIRIHSKSDNVVRRPEEKYNEIEGGHFCLTIHPEETYELMKDFIQPKVEA